MRYFRFNSGLNSEPAHDLCSDYIDAMREADAYCSYLARMYEFYFPAKRTGNVTALTVCLLDKIPEQNSQILLPSMTINTLINWTLFAQLTQKERPLYIIDLCQQAMIDLARNADWDLEPFETTYSKIKNNGGLFREHLKKPVYSPNKQLKAQIYFEDDYEKDGTYVDFTDKKGELIKRVQFTPRGYSVYCQDIGSIKWVDDSQVEIHYIQTPRAGLDYQGNKRDYWIVKIDETVEFHYPRIEEDEPNPHGLFNLGVLYWNGKIIMQDKKKGFALIKKSAELKYKHAQKWLEQNKLT